jgi:hypothetical protein
VKDVDGGRARLGLYPFIAPYIFSSVCGIPESADVMLVLDMDDADAAELDSAGEVR